MTLNVSLILKVYFQLYITIEIIEKSQIQRYLFVYQYTEYNKVYL